MELGEKDRLAWVQTVRGEFPDRAIKVGRGSQVNLRMMKTFVHFSAPVTKYKAQELKQL